MLSAGSEYSLLKLHSGHSEKRKTFSALEHRLRKIYKSASQHQMPFCSLIFSSQGDGIDKTTNQKPFNAVIIPAPLFFKYLANLGERRDQSTG